MVKMSLDAAKALNVVYDFFKQFKAWFGPSAVTPSVNDLEKFLSQNFQMLNNGQLVAKSAADYLNRLQKFQKRFSSFEISEPIEEPLITDNQVAIYYQIDLTTHTGQHKQICDMGLFTIEANKISRWITVTHEKGVESWDN